MLEHELFLVINVNAKGSERVIGNRTDKDVVQQKQEGKKSILIHLILKDIESLYLRSIYHALWVSYLNLNSVDMPT